MKANFISILRNVTKNLREVIDLSNFKVSTNNPNSKLPTLCKNKKTKLTLSSLYEAKIFMLMCFGPLTCSRINSENT